MNVAGVVVEKIPRVYKMANEQNLKPIRTKEQARKLGTRGGLVKSQAKKKAGV